MLIQCGSSSGSETLDAALQAVFRILSYAGSVLVGSTFYLLGFNKFLKIFHNYNFYQKYVQKLAWNLYRSRSGSGRFEKTDLDKSSLVPSVAEPEPEPVEPHHFAGAGARQKNSGSSFGAGYVNS
jgi:hypothetical protein